MIHQLCIAFGLFGMLIISNISRHFSKAYTYHHNIRDILNYLTRNVASDPKMFQAGKNIFVSLLDTGQDELGIDLNYYQPINRT